MMKKLKTTTATSATTPTATTAQIQGRSVVEDEDSSPSSPS